MACTKEDLAAKLRGLRAERRLSQEEVAKAVGVDQNSISAYENARSWPNYETAWKLADLYGLDSIDALGGRVAPQV